MKNHWIQQRQNQLMLFCPKHRGIVKHTIVIERLWGSNPLCPKCNTPIIHVPPEELVLAGIIHPIPRPALSPSVREGYAMVEGKND